MTIELMSKFFDPELPSTGKMFEPQSGELYWDEHNPALYAVYKKLVEQFWHAGEVSLRQDIPQFKTRLTEQQTTLFYRAIAQLMVLDTVAAKVVARLTKIIRNPAAIALLDYQSSQETIHNESYTYILSSFTSKEKVQEIKENTKKDAYFLRATLPILEIFDKHLLSKSDEEVTPEDVVYVLVGMLALEGIRFTNGFVPFYQFNREELLQAVGTIIQFINRDETQHSYGIAVLINMIIDEYDLDRAAIEKFTQDFFTVVVEAEKALSGSFFEGYTKISSVQTKAYVEFRANALLGNVGFEQIFPTVRNPMRWITAFDSNKMANQKTDFFEKKENKYAKVNTEDNGFDEL